MLISNSPLTADALAGTIVSDADVNIEAWLNVVQLPTSLGRPLFDTAELLRTGTAQAIRLIDVGDRIASRS